MELAPFAVTADAKPQVVHQRLLQTELAPCTAPQTPSPWAAAADTLPQPTHRTSPVLTNAKHRPDRMAGAALTQSQGL